MTVRVSRRVGDQGGVESDITITATDGKPLAVFDGFYGAVAERVLTHVARAHRQGPVRNSVVRDGPTTREWSAVRAQPQADSSWLVLVDDSGVGATLAEELRRRGHRVRTVEHQPSPGSPRSTAVT